ncbi:hypothetical protein GP486_006841 [Trichoglossum hirsutum]|uniref:ethanolamine-phosphate cytidylyltransferase n=1 Tax=Trichoglossum hirsutum TaxID=265104 RepID=A0A9P8IDT4_9PEZI|nr:hypothetical protein GP486_006841 [Trichoglossum hirsutum]
MEGMDGSAVSAVPAPGRWPVDPQEDAPVSKDRIWVDGCFDFSHHGHAGAMLQARRLGSELLVGIHSDEEIMDNKGPTVMTLEERGFPQLMRAAGLHDPSRTLPTGQDCYRHVKAAGRFRVVKRTPGISTTDLVGRMLLCTKVHFIKSLMDVLAGDEGSGNDDERRRRGQEMRQRIEEYASDETGLKPGPEVWTWNTPVDAGTGKSGEAKGGAVSLVEGKAPRPGQSVVYVDGGFDLFSSGHIEFLRLVVKDGENSGRQRGWYEEDARRERLAQHGEDYGPIYVVAGVHDDEVINYWKGVNYPIMNIFERGLCVLQCRYIHSVVFSAPFIPTRAYLSSLPYGLPTAVYHGPTSFMPSTSDPYLETKTMGIFREIGEHPFQDVNASQIVRRIMKSREMYEERQRIKGIKGVGEDAVKRREEMERDADRVSAAREASSRS